MSINKKLFGKSKNNEDVYIYTIKNENGMMISVCTYGATLTSCIVPDKYDKFHDVLLGYDTLTGYENGDKFFGATVGRFANRIAKGQFTLNNKKYELYINDGPNHLHGGKVGFDKVIWHANPLDEENALELSYLSKDGEEGYPGNLKVTVRYTLKNDNSYEISYSAVSDKDTIINLTNHSYFNLSGHNSGHVLNQKVMLNADNFTVNDEYSIPTGEIRSVKSTPMDFSTLKAIGQNILDSDYEQIKFGHGYDHNWVLNTKGNLNEKAAEALAEDTGIIMDMYTTQPGVQFYTANFLDGSDIGKGNCTYNIRNGFCFETQHFPDCIHHDNFASPILKADEKYEQKTIFKFSTLK